MSYSLHIISFNIPYPPDYGGVMDVFYKIKALHDLGPLEAHAEAHAARGRGLALDPDSKYLVNPGSVGQPRDSDPRAAYMIFDADAQHIDMCRVDYPVGLTQEKMASAGLPDPLVRRLAAGR